MSKRNGNYPHAHGAFSRRADSFKVGQRVELSPYADAHGIRPGKKSGRIGTVVKLDPPFTVYVLQDGYKQRNGFAAWFWQPLTKRRPR